MFYIWEYIRIHFIKDKLKYWLGIIIFSIVCFLIGYYNYNLRTDNLLLNFDNTIYVGNGVAINDRTIITSKNIIDENCYGRATGKLGEIYVIDNKIPYKMIIEGSDNINNLIALKTSRFHEKVSNYITLPPKQIIHKKDSILYTPISVNRVGKFNLKDVVVLENNTNSFEVSIKSSLNKRKIIGYPIFDNKYSLQGIIKEENSNGSGLFGEKKYSINDTKKIKIFLRRNKINYHLTGRNQPTNNPKKSIVNILCIRKY